jgi:hypothetical protein
MIGEKSYLEEKGISDQMQHTREASFQECPVWANRLWQEASGQKENQIISFHFTGDWSSRA